MTYKHEVIFCIVNTGFSDAVMDAAKFYEKKGAKPCMIVLSNDVKVVFSSMGLFSSNEAWCHPEVAISSYEFIFVTEGIVYIEEDGKEYTLRAGDLFCLRPNVIHRGVRESKNVSFFTSY